VPNIPDTDQLDAGAIADLIAGTDYDASAPKSSAKPSAGRSATAAPRPLTPTQQRQQTWRDRLRKRR
jgi:hypothetical protein